MINEWMISNLDGTKLTLLLLAMTIIFYGVNKLSKNVEEKDKEKKKEE